MQHSSHTAPIEVDVEEKRVALSYVSEAFAEGCLDGLDGDCMAQ